jgi:heptosyltransferase-2
LITAAAAAEIALDENRGHPKPSKVRILIIKTAALGDVLRTTSILPGLVRRWPQARVTWATSPAAADLVAHHPLVERVHPVDAADEESVRKATADLGTSRWDWVISLDDEVPLCRLAAALPAARLSGAYFAPGAGPTYTPDTAPWFDMGLLSKHGKAEADRLKVANRRSHPAIYADMLGIEMGRPQLPLPAAAMACAAEFARRHALEDVRPLIGLNTGAGGRWRSKGLPPGRAVELVRALDAARGSSATFLLLGGPEEAGRNRELLADLRALRPAPRIVDGGTSNGLLEFAALVDRCDVLISSDSLALHVAVARGVPVVAFFAPTSAAEIELYGQGEKVASTAPDYCSYRPDADNATITAERLCAAALRVLAAPR